MKTQGPGCYYKQKKKQFNSRNFSLTLGNSNGAWTEKNEHRETPYTPTQRYFITTGGRGGGLVERGLKWWEDSRDKLLDSNC